MNIMGKIMLPFEFHSALHSYKLSVDVFFLGKTKVPVNVLKCVSREQS